MRSASPIAKVTRPIPSGYYPRHRLYRLLDKARKVPVLWITGPPGCGKTALVSSYIESRRLPCLWYKVDDTDADIGTFFYYLGLAAGKAAPRRKKPLPLLTPDRLPGLSVFAKRYFEDLSARLPVPSLLVFDDCHRVADGSQFFETIREGISRLPTGIAVVLISRKNPHPSFTRDRANRLMEALGWNDLRLTLEEVAGITKLQRKKKPATELVARLFERTDGWAAGLMLLLGRTDRDRVEPRNIGQQIPAEFFDYFGSEIFLRLEEDRKAFLLRSAFLPKMTASMAAKLTGSEMAGQILSELNRQNYFTERYSGREPVYEYHALFREYLLAQAEGSFSAGELAGIRRAAASLLEQYGYVEDAAVLFRRAEDWEALGRVILLQARLLVAQGRNQTLLDWLGAFPRGVVNDDPWLLYWTGVCLLPFSPAGSRTPFEEAFQKFEERMDAVGVFASWSGAVDSILMEMNHYTLLDAWTTILPRLLEKYGGLPPGEIGERVTCSMFKALSFRELPRSEVKHWTERALVLARTSEDSRVKIETAVANFYCHQSGSGEYREAERTLVAMKGLLKRPDATPMSRLWVYHLEGTVARYLSMPERCIRVISEGIAYAEAANIHIVSPVLLAYGALSALQQGDFDAADRFLDRMAESVETKREMLSALFHFAAGVVALDRRDLRMALHHSKECIGQLERTGHRVDLPVAYLLAAHVHHELQEFGEADGYLAEARRIGSEIESPHAAWLSDLTEAYFCIGRNDVAAVAALRRGLRTGSMHGFVGSLLWLTGFYETVAARALEEGIEVEYVRDFIKRNRLVPDPAKMDLSDWPWPVKVYTLGRFGLLVDDRPVEFGRKVQQRPLSLLKALIALGGRDVSESRLTELLWPEADGDLAHQSFSAALNRLRNLLGIKGVLILKEGRLSLSNRHCWVDVWAFERFLRQVEKVRKDQQGAEAIRNFGKGLSLYRGTFLPSEEMSWAVSRREKLQNGFLSAVAHLGRCYEEQGKWDAAASCYGIGLNADEVAEELYRRLMICHIRQGREADALSVYRRCRSMLSSVLGVNPSAETRAVVASLGRS